MLTWAALFIMIGLKLAGAIDWPWLTFIGWWFVVMVALETFFWTIKELSK